MISQRELASLRAEWMLDQNVIEKDYVLGWLLAGIAHHEELARTWVFKGGTCLRKCYYETFRFSEDLDFTIVNGQPCPPGIAPIKLSIAETIRLARLAGQHAAGLITRARLAFALRWSLRRRRHQAVARWHHYSTRLLAGSG